MLRLEDLEVYKTAMGIGEMVSDTVEKWAFFHKDTLGKQFVRAADSIAFNISEGYGRFFYKENRNFCYYSRGSASETKTAIAKALQRGLISPQEYDELCAKLEFYFRLMNPYIRSIGRQVEADDNAPQ
jgi:four helix bundle protein